MMKPIRSAVEVLAAEPHVHVGKRKREAKVRLVAGGRSEELDRARLVPQAHMQL